MNDSPDAQDLDLPAPRTFRYEERDRVGIITLDRPDRFNALTFAVYRELADLFAVIDRRANAPGGARAIVLQGAGKAFCSGGDVEDIIGHLFARDIDGLVRFTRMTGELIANMRRCKLPIVASVKRVAAGAGAVMALASDLRVMGRHAFFAFLFPQVGLSGADMGASWLLPRVVGLGIASEILLLGERVPAERCERIGLANALVDDDDPSAVDLAAFELAQRLAAGPHFAARMTKTMLAAELGMGFADGIESEAQTQAICMQHPDFREAHEAWKAGRNPRWA